MDPYVNIGDWSLEPFPTDQWTFQASPEPSDEMAFNTGQTLPQYFPLSHDPMPAIEYGQDSSHSSDRSYSGSVPSSITSYNEHDITGVSDELHPDETHRAIITSL